MSRLCGSSIDGPCLSPALLRQSWAQLKANRHQAAAAAQHWACAHSLCQPSCLLPYQSTFRKSVDIWAAGAGCSWWRPPPRPASRWPGHHRTTPGAWVLGVLALPYLLYTEWCAGGDTIGQCSVTPEPPAQPSPARHQEASCPRRHLHWAALCWTVLHSACGPQDLIRWGDVGRQGVTVQCPADPATNYPGRDTFYNITPEQSQDGLWFGSSSFGDIYNIWSAANIIKY